MSVIMAQPKNVCTRRSHRCLKANVFLKISHSNCSYCSFTLYELLHFVAWRVYKEALFYVLRSIVDRGHVCIIWMSYRYFASWGERFVLFVVYAGS